MGNKVAKAASSRTLPTTLNPEVLRGASNAAVADAAAKLSKQEPTANNNDDDVHAHAAKKAEQLQQQQKAKEQTLKLVQEKNALLISNMNALHVTATPLDVPMAVVDRQAPATSRRAMPQSKVLDVLDPDKQIATKGRLNTLQIRELFALLQQNADAWSPERLSERFDVPVNDIRAVAQNYATYSLSVGKHGETWVVPAAIQRSQPQVMDDVFTPMPVHSTLDPPAKRL